MIEDFQASWDLFHNTYLAGWLIAVVLSLIGVLVVAKDQIFIGAAVSQASALGVALATWAGSFTVVGFTGEGEPEWLVPVMAVSFSVLAALATSRAGGGRRESHEAVTGWVFLLSASLSVLVLSHSPHGLEEIQRLASSSLIGATGVDVLVLTGLVAASAALFAIFNRRLLLLITDRAMAESVGMRAGLWSAVLAVWLGVCVGISLRVSGMLYTFGLMVLPALVAKNLCREIRPMFIVSPAVGLAAAVAAFVFANHYDYPPGQMSVALLAGMLVVAWMLRRATRFLWRVGQT